MGWGLLNVAELTKSPTIFSRAFNDQNSIIQAFTDWFQVPTLILYGSNDKAMGDPAYEDLRHIPGSVPYVMQGCGHPCYLDNPAEWHKIIYNVMNKVESI